MPMYILLGTLTFEGQRMLRGTSDLMSDAIRETPVPGAKVLGSYAVLGEYDFVMIVEADDNATAARLSLELGVKTGLHLETLPAIALGVLAGQSPRGGDVETQVVQGIPEEWRLPQTGPGAE